MWAPRTEQAIRPLISAFLIRFNILRKELSHTDLDRAQTKAVLAQDVVDIESLYPPLEVFLNPFSPGVGHVRLGHEARSRVSLRPCVGYKSKLSIVKRIEMLAPDKSLIITAP